MERAAQGAHHPFYGSVMLKKPAILKGATVGCMSVATTLQTPYSGQH
jgi:hypothetical protein